MDPWIVRNFQLMLAAVILAGSGIGWMLDDSRCSTKVFQTQSDQRRPSLYFAALDGTESILDQIIYVRNVNIGALYNGNVLSGSFRGDCSYKRPDAEYASSNDQIYGGEGYKPRRYDQPPFIRRFLESVFLIPLSFCFTFIGGYQFYSGRNRSGVAFAICGWLVFCLGAGIIILNMWPTTWEWWI